MRPKKTKIFSPAFCLETGVESDQEGMIRGLLKNVLFCLDPVDVLEEKDTKTNPKYIRDDTVTVPLNLGKLNKHGALSTISCT